MPRRNGSPIFVLGSARSGTTLLYHMLLSSGTFAVFRAETHAFNVLAPRFGNLRSATDRRRLIKEWLDTRQFQLSGLDREEFAKRALAECRCVGDFLSLFMGSIARAQGVQRWADCTPAHAVHLRQIKREIPDALVIHIIRDGRDVAASLAKQGWATRLPGDTLPSEALAGLAWRWQVRRARRNAGALRSAYLEISFEDLVRQPQATLDDVGRFIDQPLDYERIKAVGIGSVSKPNSSFRDDNPGGFNPVARWQSQIPQDVLASLEFLLSDTLPELGYSLTTTLPRGRAAAGLAAKRMAYDALLSAKLRARAHTPLGRLTSNSPLHENW